MLKKPIFLTLILIGIPTSIIILSVILEVFVGIKVPFLICIADIASILLVSWLYLNKYNSAISKDIRLKTALYCMAVSTVPLSIIFIVSFGIAFVQFNLMIMVLSIFALLLIASIRFVYIYFGLAIASKFLMNKRNYAKNKNEITNNDLEHDEKIIFRANKKFTLIKLISIFFSIVIWYIIFRFQFHYLWYDVPCGKLILIGGIIGSIVSCIDYYFIADFLVTNKRIIFKRIYYLGKVKDIFLQDIESMSSKTRFKHGIITVVSKKGFSLRSIALLHPVELQENIEKYLAELKI